MFNLWDKRYALKEYVYGKEPNRFFAEQLTKLPVGKILLPAEGEGRNSVFAAKLGWNVYAFDGSSEAKKKAEKLASGNKVEINYQHCILKDVEYPTCFFDLIGLFYAHLPGREYNHKKLITYLKPGGTIILEGFSKKQIINNTGGPKKLEMLFSQEELESDFKNMSELKIWEKQIVLTEGKGHQGLSSVIRLIGKK